MSQSGWTASPASGILGLVQSVLKSLLFVPHENPAGRIRPLLSLGWTLNYEMFFYLVFALFLGAPQGLRFPAVASVFAILVLLGAAFPAQNPAWITYTDPIILEFVFGMGLARALISGATLPKWGAGALALLGVCGFALLSRLSLEDLPHRWIMFGLPATALVAGFVWLEAAGARFAWRLPKLLGDASYSLYLTHIFTLGALRWLWTAAEAPQDPLLFTLAGAAASCIVAVLSYKLVERPLVLALSRFVPRSRASTVRAAT